MANSSVLQDFLVQLGFKLDTEGLKRFEAGITQAGKAVVGLALAVEGAAAAVAVGVSRFASNLEALYFASQRTGASATNLKAFEVTMRNFGVSASEAQAAVEGMASFLRNNPSGEGLLRGWGLMTRDPKTGRMLGPDELVAEFARATAKMPFYLANLFAKNIGGISENVLLQLRNIKFTDSLKENTELLKAAGFDKAAENSHRFMVGLRALGTQLEIFGTQVEDALQKRLGVSLEGITAWLRMHGQDLTDRIIDALKKLLDWAEQLKPRIEWVYDKLVALDHATNGWSTDLLASAVVLERMGGAQIVGGILSLTAAFVRLGAAMVGVGAGGAAAGGILGVLGVGGAIGGALLDKFFPNNPLARLGNFIGGKLYEHTDRYAEAMRTFENLGYTHAQASGIVANLDAESGLNPTKWTVDSDNQLHQGLAQWGPTRWAKFLQFAQANNLDRNSFGAQAQFIKQEMMSFPDAYDLMNAASSDAYLAGFNFSRFYEMPKGGDDTASERGDRALSLSQKIDIHVNGADSPTTTAKEVRDALERQSAAMTRNFVPRYW